MKSTTFISCRESRFSPELLTIMVTIAHQRFARKISIGCGSTRSAKNGGSGWRWRVTRVEVLPEEVGAGLADFSSYSLYSVKMRQRGNRAPDEWGIWRDGCIHSMS